MQKTSMLRAGKGNNVGLNLLIFWMAIVVSALLGKVAHGQEVASPIASNKVSMGKGLSAQEKLEVIQSLSGLLKENYVFPDIADQIIDHIETKEKAGEYSTISDEKEFANALTADIRSANDDRHLQVWLTPPTATTDETNLGTELSRASGKHSNYGFEEVRILPGNIGYIKMSSFSLDQIYDEAKTVAATAMSFVGNSDSIIFDLRNNTGGSPRLARYLSSYLYTAEPVHLNDFYFRTSDQTLEYWTLETVTGKRMPDTQVFILINSGTFSAAEGFAYNLKHLDRATIVGEASGGGAHGGSTHSVTDKFRAYIPFSRSIHPVTKTDFEGVGVIPDVEVKSQDALLTSHMLAIESLAGSKLNERYGELYAKTLESLRAQQNPVALNEAELRKYVGTYEIAPQNSLVITAIEGQLFGQMTGDPQAVAVSPITKTRFRVDDHNVEFTFELNADGEVTGLTLHQGSGVKAKKTD